MGVLPNVNWRRVGVTVLLLTITSILIWYRSFLAFFDWAKLSKDWLIIMGYGLLLAAYMYVINICYRKWGEAVAELPFRQVLLRYILPVTALISIFNTLYLQIFVIAEIPNLLLYPKYWLEDYPCFLVSLLLYVVDIHYFPELRILSKKDDTKAAMLLELWSTTRDPRVLMDYLHAEHGAEGRGDPLTARWMDMVLFYHEASRYFVYLRNGEKLAVGIGRSDFLDSVVGPWFVEVQRSVYINMLYVDRDTWNEKQLRLHGVGAKALPANIIEQIEERLKPTRRGGEKIDDFVAFRLHADANGWEERVNLSGEN